MKKMSVLFLAMGLLSVGCSQGQRSVVKEETKETIGMTRPDWSEEKAKFLEQSETRIRDISEDLVRMERSDLKTTKRQKEKVGEAIKDTKGLLGDARENLNSLRGIGADDWNEEQEDFLSTMNRLEEKFSSVRNYYY